jgi:ABC-type Mn2+/Zn2+ transport system permease subunit
MDRKKWIVGALLVFALVAFPALRALTASHATGGVTVAQTYWDEDD